MNRVTARGASRSPRRARQRVWASGMVVVLALIVFGAVGLRPLASGRTEDRRVRIAVTVLQEIADLRTAMSAWQVYIEPHFAEFSMTRANIDPAELGKGAILDATQIAEVNNVLGALEPAGLDADAAALRAADASYTEAIAKIAPLGDGAPPAEIAAVEAEETSAYSKMFATTARSADRLRARSGQGLDAASNRLDSGRRGFLIVDATAVCIALAGAFLIGQNARRREEVARLAAERQEFESALQDALEMAKTEADAYATMRTALTGWVPNRHVQVLVADSSRAHFHQTLHTTDDDTATQGCGVVSPSDCPATRRGHTLVFPTSSALNACPFLRNRPTGELSAACVPFSMTGRTSGVVHATGADAAPATEVEIDYLEITARRVGERVAMLRAFEKSEAQARTDPLTGLWNRRSLEDRMSELNRDGTSYALAYGDLDQFKKLNDTHGHESGDQALRLFSRVVRDSIRPSDICARYGGEEFILVLPDCMVETATKILERLRERLALTLTSGRVPSFTVSFGLASSTDSDTFTEVVARADEALLTAKANGRNRTVVAAGQGAQPPPMHVVPAPAPTG